jgi:hypothetical protein
MRARRSDWDRWRPVRLDQGTRKDRPREHAAMLVALLILASPTDSEGFRRCRPEETRPAPCPTDTVGIGDHKRPP